MLGACGDGTAGVYAGQAATTSTTAATTATAARNYSADLTTTDGYRYTVTLVIGTRSATGRTGECPGKATPAKAYLPVTLTVANVATDKSAPFPPVRIEMTATPGAKPAPVLVLDAAGTCTFTPRVPSIGPGASAVFNGTSPAIDEAVAAGAAGTINVKVSETTFSLVAPVP